MNKLLLIGLLGLTNCASFVADFEEGFAEGQAIGHRALNTTGDLVVGMAAIDRYDRATQAQRTEEIKMIPQAPPVCVQRVDYFGRVLPCN